LIQGFQDNALEQFLLAPNEAIAQLIEENNESLEGVFLTRYEHTFMPNGQLRALWESVEAVCDQNDIPSSPLVTPSGGYRGMTVPEKQEAWRGMIFPAP
jgi:hypothetical protein